MLMEWSGVGHVGRADRDVCRARRGSQRNRGQDRACAATQGSEEEGDSRKPLRHRWKSLRSYFRTACEYKEDSMVLSFDSAGQTLGSGTWHLRGKVGFSGQLQSRARLQVCRETEGEYDRLGFLLKLDSKLPAELATKYANFSEGACKPGYASALMTAIFPRFSRPAPMFLDDSFRKWARIREFVPPFGIKGQDNLIKAILSVTKEYRLTPALDSLSCRRCIIVGNGGVLANKSLGSRIDDYDIVVRLNSAPVKGFEKDVGSKTTLRITYPEGAMQRPEQYERDSLFVLAGFKWQDFKWLKYIVYKERVPLPKRGQVQAVSSR
ncbi:CMP-N-acetylneuraminate-beta-1,4-galactoside alpha-2,3-sialyltransferase isoform X6 [Molossus molossus]|uniref:CMP-N-acetylneuraminate-beta-1,4-galactoside alpha-2,3-sialyltransferase isoform X6 n=1 Tax=Molossus molossus TaxID=27622 RepID=UPI00174723AB|nr:CMP-N-acetylneuraminate-beta-1,4-galactoside alpha-2,3-sialyltransferase isoform X6 [Molossus molossus]